MNIEITFLILLMLSKLLLAIWIYKDARSRNLEAVIWSALVLFFSSILTFLFYVLVSRKIKMNRCEDCGYKQQAGIPFCGNCGNEVPIIAYDDQVPNLGNKIILALSITLAVVGLTIGIVSIVKYSNNLPLSIIQSESKFSNKWVASFKFRNGSKSQSFNVKDNNYLDTSWNIEKGDIEVVLKLGDEIIKEFNSLDIHQFNEYIDLSDYSGEKVILTIKCNKASGNFGFSLEEY